MTGAVHEPAGKPAHLAERAAGRAPACRGCGLGDITRILDLGAMPAADDFPPANRHGPDPTWPLELWFCPACTLVQLGPVEQVPPEIPLAVESATSIAHAEATVRELLASHPELAGATVVEFDSPHGGSWLSYLTGAGLRPPAAGQRAELVVDVHGVIHEPATGQALAERAQRLAPGGLLLLEFHHLRSLVEYNQFDLVRHAHWAYLSVAALSRLAAPLGLRVESVREVAIYGGSLQVALRHTGAHQEVPDPSVAPVLAAEEAAGLTDAVRLAELHPRAHACARALHEYLAEAKAAGRRVLGYGAPSKAPVLLGLGGIGPELLPFTADAAPGKHGRRIGGTGVGILPVEELRAARPDVVLLLTWDIADEVIGALESGGGWGAEYLVPVPMPRVLAR